MPGLLSRMGSLLTRSNADTEAEELKATTGKLGTTAVAACGDRTVVTVSGVLKSVSLPPKGSVPALVAEVYDGTGSLDLVFLGRRHIGGVKPGAYVRATGRVTYRRGVPSIFNPTYELLPPRARS